MKENGTWTWAPLSPEQIKSAIGNNGDFDSANPDIRFSRSVREQGLPRGIAHIPPRGSCTSSRTTRTTGRPSGRRCRGGQRGARRGAAAELAAAREQFGPGAVYVPPMDQEADGENTLPQALAELYAAETEGTWAQVSCR